MPIEIKRRFILILFTILAVVVLSIVLIESSIFEPTPPPYVTINTKEETLDLYEIPGLIVIDANNCSCTYNAGHLPKAVWSKTPSLFYGYSNTFLVYGDVAEEFCDELAKNVDGDIYYYTGDYKLWMES